MKKLDEIIAEIFNIDEKKIDDKMSRDNTEEWDSFNHLLLISTIEKEMKIKFTMSEIEKIKTIKELKENIKNKTT